MSIVTNVHRWFLHRRNPPEKLIADTKKLAAGLLTKEIASKKLRKAEQYKEGFGQKSKWEVWGWLIRTQRTASEQPRHIQRCLAKIAVAKKLQLDGEQLSRFEALFRSYDPGFAGLPGLQTALKNSHTEWELVALKIREIRAPVYFTHALLRLSDSSGIETASLLIAGLIALGALHMAFFYEAAVKLPAMSYWTLDDLLNHGILVIPYVVIVLVLLELVVFGVRRVFRYQLHRWVLNRPVLLMTLFFLLLVAVVTTQGYSRGEKKFTNFSTVVFEHSQEATVTDGTILRDVYLVKTSDRTAIFFQADVAKQADKATFENWQKKLKEKMSISERPSYFMVASRVAQGLLGNDPAPYEDSKDLYKVLVMDRALIVCHGRVEECEEQKSSSHERDTERGLRELKEALGGSHEDLAKRLDEIKPVIQIALEQTDAMENHMRDHFPRTLDAMGERWRQTAPVDQLSNERN